jgi:hypothetical protein
MARPYPAQLGGVRRNAVHRNAEATLQLRRATEDNPRPDHLMPLELDGQSFQEGVAL